MSILQQELVFPSPVVGQFLNLLQTKVAAIAVGEKSFLHREIQPASGLATYGQCTCCHLPAVN